MKYLRYKGEFLSISNVLWRAEIWQVKLCIYAAAPVQRIITVYIQPNAAYLDAI